uniref:Uncharacterized protein n=1 Tax=Mesocestoides corti TaxID=53468 RepID=A0A5K3G0L8_MESCO
MGRGHPVARAVLGVPTATGARTWRRDGPILLPPAPTSPRRQIFVSFQDLRGRERYRAVDACLAGAIFATTKVCTYPLQIANPNLQL